MVKLGSRDTIKIEPFKYLINHQQYADRQPVRTHPIAYVWQSPAGARAVIGSNIVRALSCSVLEGLNMITLPCEFPEARPSVSANLMTET